MNMYNKLKTGFTIAAAGVALYTLTTLGGCKGLEKSKKEDFTEKAYTALVEDLKDGVSCKEMKYVARFYSALKAQDTKDAKKIENLEKVIEDIYKKSEKTSIPAFWQREAKDGQKGGSKGAMYEMLTRLSGANFYDAVVTACKDTAYNAKDILARVLKTARPKFKPVKITDSKHGRKIDSESFYKGFATVPTQVWGRILNTQKYFGPVEDQRKQITKERFAQAANQGRIDANRLGFGLITKGTEEKMKREAEKAKKLAKKAAEAKKASNPKKTVAKTAKK